MRVELSRRGIQGKCELDGDYPALEVHFMYSGRFDVVSVYITVADGFVRCQFMLPRLLEAL
jgi:hypothetical protein